MANIPELLEQLAEARKARMEAGEYYGSVKEREEELKIKVEAALKETGLKSAKTSDGRFGATIAERPNIAIVDEKKAIKWLKAEKLDLDYYTGIKTMPFKSLVESKLKETGEIVPGTEMTMTEYITFRENKPKEPKDAEAKQ